MYLSTSTSTFNFAKYKYFCLNFGKYKYFEQISSTSTQVLFENIKYKYFVKSSSTITQVLCQKDATQNVSTR